ELAKSIMSGEGNLFYIRPSQAFKLGEFVYKPDPKLSNPLKTLSVLQGYKKNLQQLSQELSLLERREYDLNAELSSLRSSLVNNQKDIFDLKAEIRYLESVKNHILGDNSQHEIVEKERKLSKANEELMLLNQDLATLEPIRRSLELELDRLEGEFKNLKNQTKSESVSRREEVQSCIQECLTEIISIKDRLQTLELKIAEFEQNKQYFEFELKTQFHSLLEKYNIEESMVSDCKDFSNITSECQSIDEEIQRFGRESLNLLAFDESLVGEFEALEEEYNQLTTHIDDCQSSIEKLTTLREQYLSEYNEAFGDYFGRVQERFNQIIGKLFPGARGQLLLVDGGLAIEVQFKNKKPSNLNQLSGGEKTLVSLSFLSALAFESGSPVLLLDEVDAPLDDFNTSRFLELVKELKKDCQVIAVTHNKMTMLAADTLLGVTLSQDGFSEALLLNLSDIPLEVAS
ncbi:MAG: AAA family ATPase, partial [Deltaproteobacteria bacterium]|nr:AAA family ATPase [Deltaproteobacteria bacterium]